MRGGGGGGRGMGMGQLPPGGMDFSAPAGGDMMTLLQGNGSGGGGGADSQQFSVPKSVSSGGGAGRGTPPPVPARGVPVMMGMCGTNGPVSVLCGGVEQCPKFLDLGGK